MNCISAESLDCYVGIDKEYLVYLMPTLNSQLTRDFFGVDLLYFLTLSKDTLRSIESCTSAAKYSDYANVHHCCDKNERSNDP